ncbi:hypothetical protein VPH35_000118 [Triticum aestivum]
MALLQCTRHVSAATPAAAVATSVPGASSTPPALPPPLAAAGLAAAALASCKAAPTSGGHFSQAGHLPVLQQSSSDARPDLDQEQAALGQLVLIGSVFMEVPPGKYAAPALLDASVTASRGLDCNGVSSNEDVVVEMALQTPLASASADQLTRRPHSVLWASAADEDDDEDDSEDLAPRSPPAAAKVIDSDSAKVCMEHRPDTRGGWQEVLPRRGTRHPSSLAPYIGCSPHPCLAVWQMLQMPCSWAPCGCLQRSTSVLPMFAEWSPCARVPQPLASSQLASMPCHAARRHRASSSSSFL